jgi:hypothetical protein
VHRDVGDAQLGDDPRQFRVGQSPADLVHDGRALTYRGTGSTGAHRLDADRDSGRSQLADHGQDSSILLCLADPAGPGPSRLSPDVDEVGAVRGEALAMLHGGGVPEVLTAIGNESGVA